MNELDEIEFVCWSVTAAQDVYNEFQKSGKSVRIESRDVNTYTDPTSGERKRYVDPDTARKQAKKLAAK